MSKNKTKIKEIKEMDCVDLEFEDNVPSTQVESNKNSSVNKTIDEHLDLMEEQLLDPMTPKRSEEMLSPNPQDTTINSIITVHLEQQINELQTEKSKIVEDNTLDKKRKKNLKKKLRKKMKKA